MDIRIRTASEADALWCWQLEQRLNYHRSNAENVGFLLSATEREYITLQATAVLNIARLDGNPVGFVLALPPEHTRLKVLLGLRDRFTLNDPKALDLPRLLWIAKVGVLPDYARSGIGTMLYQDLFRSFPDSPMMTATLIKPIVNRASADFHQKLGFEKIGTLPSPDRADLNGLSLVSAIL